MGQRFSLLINKRTWRLAAIGVLFLFTVVFFSPIPMTEEHLTNGTGTWCSLMSIPLARLGFSQTGDFYYQGIGPDGGGGITSYVSAHGTWEMNEAVIDVVLDMNNTSDVDAAFSVRPLLGGRLLWTAFGFGEDAVGIPIWKKC